MNKRGWMAAAALLSLGMLLAPARSQGAARPKPLPGGVVVRTRPGANVNTLARDYGARVVARVPDTSIYSLAPRTSLSGSPPAYPSEPATPAGPGPTSPPILPVSSDPRVVAAEPNQDLNVQIHIGFDGDKEPGKGSNADAYAAMRLEEAHQVADGAGVRVAVLDTGVAPDHPDLQGHLAPGYNALSPGTAPLDLPDGVTNQAHGHGTMVASLLAEVAPKAEIIPVRVLNGDGSGSLFAVLQGIRYAVTQKVDVINLSFGTSRESSLLDQALDEAEEAGILIVAAAGNQGSRAKHYPASAGGTLAVASVETALTRSAFSNYGSEIQVVAVGSSIRAAFCDGGYATWSGTSVAAPFVSGGAALVLSTHPTWKGEEVAERLRDTAHSVDPFNPAHRGMLGHGLIDLAAAAAR